MNSHSRNVPRYLARERFLKREHHFNCCSQFLMELFRWTYIDRQVPSGYGPTQIGTSWLWTYIDRYLVVMDLYRQVPCGYGPTQIGTLWLWTYIDRYLGVMDLHRKVPRGYGRRLMKKRLRVRISEQDASWIFSLDTTQILYEVEGTYLEYLMQ